MKSHLIPEPQPLEQSLFRANRINATVRGEALSNPVQYDKMEEDRDDNVQRVTELPMRNFLRVVFAH